MDLGPVLREASVAHAGGRDTAIVTQSQAISLSASPCPGATGRKAGGTLLSAPVRWRVSLSLYASNEHVALDWEPGTLMHHILVVDDDPVTRTILTSLLTGEGYTVTTVASATEALEAITS